jgi:hypothetical protein
VTQGRIAEGSGGMPRWSDCAMFDHTLPLSETTQFSPTDLLHGGVERQEPVPSGNFSSTLSPSLLSDLKRFADDTGTTDLLPAMAASVRHGKPLALQIQHGRSIVRLSIFPRDQLFHCAVNLSAMTPALLSQLRLVHIEPEYMLAPFGSDGRPASSLAFGTLGTLLWMLALYGARDELLPEIAGAVRYRLAANLSTHGLPIEMPAMPLLQRLRDTALSVEEMARWTVLGSSQIRRLLNALYLQSGLMITRAFPVPGPSPRTARFGRP